jgi:hypothetical protein
MKQNIKYSTMERYDQLMNEEVQGDSKISLTH